MYICVYINCVYSVCLLPFLHTVYLSFVIDKFLMDALSNETSYVVDLRKLSISIYTPCTETSYVAEVLYGMYLL